MKLRDRILTDTEFVKLPSKDQEIPYLYRFLSCKDSVFRLNCTTGEAHILFNKELKWVKIQDS
jgi:hypothetical protein